MAMEKRAATIHRDAEKLHSAAVACEESIAGKRLFLYSEAGLGAALCECMDVVSAMDPGYGDGKPV